MYEYTPEHILRSLSGEEYETARFMNEKCRYYVVVTEYVRGNAYECRQLPWYFASEDEAIKYAEEWKECNEESNYQTSVWERK